METIYSAFDYAGLNTEDWSFYYGYEAYLTDDEDDGSDTFGFVAKYKGEEVVRYRTETLGDIDIEDNMAKGVLLGIGRMIQEGLVK